MKQGGAGGETPIGDGGGEAAAEQRTPVSEELVWKARSEDAEKEVERLTVRLAEVERELAESVSQLDSAEMKRQIDRELFESDALDLEACCLLTEAAVSQMDEPDVGEAVRDLRKRKPYLFHSHGGSGYAAGSGRATMLPAAHAGDGLDEMASSARASGDRAALLRYLRQRRG